MTGIREALTMLWSTPDSAKMVQESKTWHTWAEVRETAERIDAELGRLGCGPRSRIGVVLTNRTESVAALIAILAHDRILLTLNPAQPARRIVEDAVGAHPDVILAPREYWADEEFAAPLAEAGIIGLAFDGQAVTCVFGSGPVSRHPEQQDPVAVEMFTSGTTGPPKRVPLTWRQLEAALAAVHGHTGKGRGDHEPFTGPVALISLSMVHIGGLWGVIQALSEARPIVLMPRFTVDGWADAVYEHRMILAGLPPAAMRSVLNADVPKEKLASLRAITAGTTFVSPELADEFTARYGIPIMIMYGATEFGGAVAGWTKPLIARWWESKRGSVGRPFPGVRMRTVDESGTVLPEGSTGRLEVSSPQTGNGVGDWVRTSDLAHLDEDGFLYIDGRADDAIVRGGFKIQPETVCNALRAHESVLDASVFGRPDERLGHVPVAVIETVEDAGEVDVDDLKTFLRTRLAAYEIPVEIHTVEALPRSVSLKVDRRRLLEMVDEIESSRAR
ncbi:class I adenylate-forming enzyme family protein [Rhodococcus sp. NPDC047139]|uniref:class I adenylate-forming enzyme family protein n=1 Tax=Rhodococcus sp. NPDC047139 TaxID=3155141 RepID=UPI0033F52A42